ncbi:TetR family transcriptional regulator C-terminal domain-containing protein [Spirillospora sp. NPDC029432]|uniref:TetR/AcrR family transcriptional regulator n=1 Tax=Spirillospora sp. NPDC029432 TaxID=3154599 RepID=UPI0034573527
MPRRVDKEARRLDVADALFRIAAREGLDGVSMRTVATEAGLSLGAVQRYFQTKDEMLHFAFDQAVQAARARLREIRPQSGGQTFPEALRRALLAFLPTDDRRLAEARVWAAFYAEAAVRPSFAASLDALDGEARANLRAAIVQGRQAGEVISDRSPEALAELILVVLDGLWWSAVRRPAGASTASLEEVVDTAVAMLSPGGADCP